MRKILFVGAVLGALGVAGVPANAQDYRQDYRSHQRAERQPHMYNALNLLEQAEAELRAASRDKGGNRNAALNSVRKAQREVRQGIRYDERN